MCACHLVPSLLPSFLLGLGPISAIQPHFLSALVNPLLPIPSVTICSDPALNQRLSSNPEMADMSENSLAFSVHTTLALISPGTQQECGQYSLDTLPSPSPDVPAYLAYPLPLEMRWHGSSSLSLQMTPY